MVKPATFVKWRLWIDAVVSVAATTGMTTITVVYAVNRDWSPAFGAGLLLALFSVPTSVLFVRLLLRRPWRDLDPERGRKPGDPTRPGSQPPPPEPRR